MIKPLIQIRRFSSLTLLAIVVLGGCAATPHSTSVNAVVAKPAAYDRQLVTVIGVATGDGPAIEVFDSVADAQGLDPKKALFVRSKVRKNGQTRSDMRKVGYGKGPCRGSRNLGESLCIALSKQLKVISWLRWRRTPGGLSNESKLMISVSITGQIYSVELALDRGNTTS